MYRGVPWLVVLIWHTPSSVSTICVPRSCPGSDAPHRLCLPFSSPAPVLVLTHPIACVYHLRPPLLSWFWHTPSPVSTICVPRSCPGSDTPHRLCLPFASPAPVLVLTHPIVCVYHLRPPLLSWFWHTPSPVSTICIPRSCPGSDTPHRLCLPFASPAPVLLLTHPIVCVYHLRPPFLSWFWRTPSSVSTICIPRSCPGSDTPHRLRLPFASPAPVLGLTHPIVCVYHLRPPLLSWFWRTPSYVSTICVPRSCPGSDAPHRMCLPFASPAPVLVLTYPIVCVYHLRPPLLSWFWHTPSPVSTICVPRSCPGSDTPHRLCLPFASPAPVLVLTHPIACLPFAPPLLSWVWHTPSSVSTICVPRYCPGSDTPHRLCLPFASPVPVLVLTHPIVCVYHLHPPLLSWVWHTPSSASTICVPRSCPGSDAPHRLCLPFASPAPALVLTHPIVCVYHLRPPLLSWFWRTPSSVSTICVPRSCPGSDVPHRLCLPFASPAPVLVLKHPIVCVYHLRPPLLSWFWRTPSYVSTICVPRSCPGSDAPHRLCLPFASPAPVLVLTYPIVCVYHLRPPLLSWFWHTPSSVSTICVPRSCPGSDTPHRLCLPFASPAPVLVLTHPIVYVYHLRPPLLSWFWRTPSSVSTICVPRSCPGSDTPHRLCLPFASPAPVLVLTHPIVYVYHLRPPLLSWFWRIPSYVSTICVPRSCPGSDTPHRLCLPFASPAPVLGLTHPIVCVYHLRPPLLSWCGAIKFTKCPSVHISVCPSACMYVCLFDRILCQLINCSEK